MVNSTYAFQWIMPSSLVILIKLSVMLMTAWMLHFAVRRVNPRWRVLIWRITFCSMVLIPFVLMIVPAYTVSIAADKFLPSNFVDLSRNLFVEYNPESVSNSGESVVTPTPSRESTSSSSESLTRKPIEPTPIPEHVSTLALSSKQLFAVAWIAGIIVSLLRLIPSYRWVSRIQKQSAPAPTRLCELLKRVAADLACRDPIDLRISKELETPSLCGLQSPVLILPDYVLKEGYEEELPAIFAHEIAHLQAKDVWWMTGIPLLQSVLWFHPLAWKTRAAHDAACEAVCDRVAAEYVGDAKSYSETLARVALDLITRSRSHVSICMAKPSTIRQRLQFLKRNIKAPPFTKRNYIASSMFASLCIAAIAALNVQRAVSDDAVNDSTEANTTSLTTEPYVSKGFTLRKYPKKSFPAFWINLINGLPTGDGKYASGYYYKSSDANSGNLILRDLTSGKDIFLTKEASQSKNYDSYERLENSAISPDASTVAYSWGIKKGPSTYHAELRLVDKDGKNQKTLLKDDTLIASVIRWTKDGQSLFCQLRWNQPLRIEFALVSVLDGSVKVLRTVTDETVIKNAYVIDRYPEHRTFLSPDEKYLAYTYYPDSKNDSWNSDIAIWSVEEQTEYPFVIHPAMDRMFGWSPDGRWLVFSSNRLSSNDLFYAPFSLGGPARSPTIITRGLGQIHPTGITSSGRLYFSDAVNLSDVYTASIDPEKMTFKEISAPISTSIKSPLKQSGKWSPDGKLFLFIVYASDYGVDNQMSLWIHSFPDNRSYKLAVDVNLSHWSSFESWRWFDDENIIAAVTTPGESKARLCKINCKTGQLINVDWDESVGLWGVRTHDLKKHYSTRTKEGTITLFEYDRDAKHERVLYEAKGDASRKKRHSGFTLSPDEKWLVCSYYEQSSDSQTIYFSSIRLIATRNGEHRDIYNHNVHTWINDIQWMPDSDSILFVEKKGDENSQTLMRLRLNDSKPVAIGTIPEAIQHLCIHPSGKKIAYTKYVFDSSTWVMENFLP